ncbi:MAG: helix-turn-helix domain-containing protein [Chloroflexota bacterium]|nr:helix-turn-helix domain-containing protein [Chloroflexota bacterium]
MVVGYEDLVAVREAARECGRTAETVRRWIWEGKLPAQKLGNQLFVRKDDLMRWASKLKGRDTASGHKASLEGRLAALEEAGAVRERVYRRLGSNLDVLEALDRSREAHPFERLRASS